MSYPPQPFTICSIRPSAFHAALLPAIEDLYHPQRGAPHCPAGTEAMLADPLLHLSPVSTQEIEQLQHVATTVDQHCPILTPNIIYKAIDAIDAIGTMCPFPSFASVWMSELLEPPASRASAFLTPTFRAEPADSCDGTCTCGTLWGIAPMGCSARLAPCSLPLPESESSEVWQTANSAPRWSTLVNHKPSPNSLPIFAYAICHHLPIRG